MRRLLVYGALFLGLSSVFFPMAMFRLVDGDEGIYLLASKLVVEGQLPYRDFFLQQMPLLPYVYGAWMKVFGASWYAGRALSALFAVLLGILLYHHVRQVTKQHALGVLAVLLFASNSFVLGWFVVVKTTLLASLLLFCAYAVLSWRVERWRYACCGLLLGLATDVRLYVGVIAPVMMLDVLLGERGRRTRWTHLAWLAVGLVVALLPNAFFALSQPDTFLFNVVGSHRLRSDPELVGGVVQKGQVALRLFGIYGITGADGFQFMLLVLGSVGLALMSTRVKAKVPLASSIAIVLAAASFIPTPTYDHYFSVIVPFLIVSGMRLFSALQDELGMIENGVAFARRLRRVALLGVGIYVLVSPLDVSRYTTGGFGVIGAGGLPDPKNWTIPTIRAVAKAMDEELPADPAVAISWWPGYFVESNTRILPKLENHFGLWFSVMVDTQKLDRYRLMSYRELGGHIVAHTTPLVVLGNWVDWPFPLRGVYRQVLKASGYRLSRKVGDTEIYKREGGAR